MLFSMTGFGQAIGEATHKSILVEIKSLNGRTTDLRLKLPVYYKEKEIELRRLILDQVNRGKIDALISITSDFGDSEYKLNKTLFKMYYSEVLELKNELNIGNADLVQGILRIPNVIQSNDEKLSDAEWQVVKATTLEAVNKLIQFRQKEGASIKKDMMDKILHIRSMLEEVKPFEEERILFLKTRMRKNLEEFLGKENVDKNRFEQEVIHYIEKLDINEEKMRLGQHCEYFLEVLESKEKKSKGKKLAFIGQEIGREINTLGSKAQNANIQRIVVQMKDNLEQIKEQIANVV